MYKGICELESVSNHTIKAIKESGPIWDDFAANSDKLYMAMIALRPLLSSYISSLQTIGNFFCLRGGIKDIGGIIFQITSELNKMSKELDALAETVSTESVNIFMGELGVWRKKVTKYERSYGKNMKIQVQDLKTLNDALNNFQKFRRSADPFNSSSKDYSYVVENRNISLKNIFMTQESLLTKINRESRHMGCKLCKCFNPVVNSMTTRPNGCFTDYEGKLLRAEETIISLPPEVAKIISNTLNSPDWNDPREAIREKKSSGVSDSTKNDWSIETIEDTNPVQLLEIPKRERQIVIPDFRKIKSSEAGLRKYKTKTAGEENRVKKSSGRRITPEAAQPEEQNCDVVHQSRRKESTERKNDKKGSREKWYKHNKWVSRMMNDLDQDVIGKGMKSDTLVPEEKRNKVKRSSTGGKVRECEQKCNCGHVRTSTLRTNIPSLKRNYRPSRVEIVHRERRHTCCNEIPELRGQRKSRTISKLFDKEEKQNIRKMASMGETVPHRDHRHNRCDEIPDPGMKRLTKQSVDNTNASPLSRDNEDNTLRSHSDFRLPERSEQERIRSSVHLVIKRNIETLNKMMKKNKSRGFQQKSGIQDAEYECIEFSNSLKFLRDPNNLLILPTNYSSTSGESSVHGKSSDPTHSGFSDSTNHTSSDV